MPMADLSLRHQPDAQARALLRRTGMLRIRAHTEGRPAFRIALIDGPIWSGHDSLKDANIKVVAAAERLDSGAPAVVHATFIASMLVGRGEGVVGLCPGCTLLSVPVVGDEMLSGSIPAPSVAQQLAEAVMLAVALDANVIQISLDFPAATRGCFHVLLGALEKAAAAGAIIVMPAGNLATLECNSLLASSAVIPVAASDWNGLPIRQGSLGPTVARKGFLAPGTEIPGALSPKGFTTLSGSSYAAAFLTGAFALLDSLELPRGARQAGGGLLGGSARMSGTVPQHLDAEASFTT